MLSLLLAAAPLASLPPVKTFGSWTVGCDNLASCAAISVVDGGVGGEGPNTPWVVSLTRKAGPAARVKVEAFPAFMEDSPGAVTLRLDGKKSAFGFTEGGGAVGDGARLLQAIASAKRIDVLDRKGRAVGIIPASGSSATLRYIDDRQGRVGTVTALVASGANPATAVPAPPAAPRIATPDPGKSPPLKLSSVEQKKIKKLSDLCDSEGEGPDVDTGYWRLDSSHSLAIVPCGLGAYQSNSLVIVLDNKGKWSPATIEQTYPREKSDPPIFDSLLTEADYDPARRLLTSTAKGRGLGDCGMGASWAWDGRMFRLAALDELDACAGAPPGTWLPRWHSANDPLAD